MWAQVLSNTLAAAGAGMAEPLMSLIDTAFVSRCGVIPLAALGPNTALFNV
jgi:Na+-driven multidrug efflux pump